MDVGTRRGRSRELLARRALLVERDGDEVASARPVLDDVEHAAARGGRAARLRARRRDVERSTAEVERRQLLMKIDLMTRELAG